MIYTRTGDSGTSSLYGTGVRLPKNHPVYEALGALDELNSWLGVCATEASDEIARHVESIQQRIFSIQASVAGASIVVPNSAVDDLESSIAQWENRIAMPRSFVVPGASRQSALFDYARTLARKAERRCVALENNSDTFRKNIRYLNRLSSALYVYARAEAANAQSPEKIPTYQ